MLKENEGNIVNLHAWATNRAAFLSSFLQAFADVLAINCVIEFCNQIERVHECLTHGISLTSTKIHEEPVGNEQAHLLMLYDGEDASQLFCRGTQAMNGRAYDR